MSGRKIIVDSDTLEHTLNCMAQLNFMPFSGAHSGEVIVRNSYEECRKMLKNAPEYENAEPPKVNDNLYWFEFDDDGCFVLAAGFGAAVEKWRKWMVTDSDGTLSIRDTVNTWPLGIKQVAHKDEIIA